MSPSKLDGLQKILRRSGLRAMTTFGLVLMAILSFAGEGSADTPSQKLEACGQEAARAANDCYVAADGWWDFWVCDSMWKYDNLACYTAFFNDVLDR